jgi:hypothetical protein
MRLHPVPIRDARDGRAWIDTRSQLKEGVAPTALRIENDDSLPAHLVGRALGRAGLVP